MADITYTAQLFIFDIVVHIIILISIIAMYIKTRELYSLSLQRGIKYLNNAMLFFLLGFLSKFASTLIGFLSGGAYGSFEQSLPGFFLIFINLYTSLLGGFFLAYCLVWRLFEKEQLRSRNLSRMVFLSVLALIIVTTDIYLMIGYNVNVPYFFFATAIGGLLFAIMLNSIRCSKMHISSKNLNPFLSLVGLGLGVYVVTLIETLFRPFLFTVHYYTWGVMVVFTLSFMYNVIKLTK